MKAGVIIIIPDTYSQESHRKQILLARDKDKLLKSIRLFERTKNKETIIVIDNHISKYFVKTISETSAICVEHHFYPKHVTLSSIQAGIKCFSEKHDIYFIYPLKQAILNQDTIEEMSKENADVVIPLENNTEKYPVVISDRLAKWYALYNGTRGIKGAWESFCITTAAKTHFINVINTQHTKSVINWI